MEASQHAASALVLLAVIVLVFAFLIKSLKAISKSFEIAGAIIKWFFDSVIEIASNLRVVIQNAILHGFPKLFTKQPYISLISWAAMLDFTTSRKILSRYEDGNIHIKYQRNMGFAVLTLCLWSSLAFSYAVYSAAVSFTNHHRQIGIVAIVAGSLYGALILALDRSIIAPYSQQQKTNGNSDIWEQITSDVYKLLPFFFKFVARVVIAIYVASFTALPLTLLVLQGGVAEIQDKPIKDERINKESRLREIQKKREIFVNDRLNSDQCKIANAGVKDSQKRIDEMARAGCSKGQPTCPKSGTAFFEDRHKGHVENQKTSCTPTVAEFKVFDDEILRLTTDLKKPLVVLPVDILQGATILEEIAKRQEGNRYFHPVTATYYLLFILELIPLLMKLWRDPWRRRRATV